MSDSLGIENFSGSDSTSAIRQSFGNPNPISVPSFENDRKTIRPTRNFTRPRTNASLLRGSVAANARTSSTVTATTPGYEPPPRPRDGRPSKDSWARTSFARTCCGRRTGRTRLANARWGRAGVPRLRSYNRGVEFDRFTVTWLVLRPDAPVLDEAASAALQDAGGKAWQDTSDGDSPAQALDFARRRGLGHPMTSLRGLFR